MITEILCKVYRDTSKVNKLYLQECKEAKNVKMLALCQSGERVQGVGTT